MSLKGNSNEERIWNFLISKGLNPFGVAGLMGNLDRESGLSPINLQNTYEKILGFTDDTYTTSVDNGDYQNFVHDKAGYGIAQWTYWSRKQNLQKYAQEKGASIGDLEMQLEFLIQELSSSYKSVLNVLKTATSVSQASNAVLLNFEKPANQGSSVQKERAECGQKFYDKYASGKGGTSIMGKTITTGWLSAVINGIKIKSDLRCNLDNYSSRSSRDASYVTMHYTGNNKDTARANANYFGGAGRNASAHLFVDDTEIYQSVPLNSVAWHCGAQTYKHAYCRNANSIGIEMCCTAGNYKISEKTKQNAAYLCAYICKMLGISAVIIITVSWEFAFCFEINYHTVFITDCFNFCIFDSTQRVYYVRETSDTGSKCTSYICIDQSHLCCFVVIFVMHVVNHVQSIYIQFSQPVHHGVVMFHYFVIIQIFSCDRSVSRSYLNFCLLIDTTVDCVQ